MEKDLRIISLVPSITELLFDLGLKDNIIGRTKFCIHPSSEVNRIPQFGGTKKLHLDKIVAANPTLIIANKEENLKADVELLQQHFDVLVTDVSSLHDNYEMIRKIGQLTRTSYKADRIIQTIQSNFAALEDVGILGKVLYLIWNEPTMSIGHDTFIHEMLHLAGFENICKDQFRYPDVSHLDLLPEYVFLSSEPFPFKEKHKLKLQSKYPESKFIFVDGEMFSWYGSRIQYAPAYFKNLREKLKVI